MSRDLIGVTLGGRYELTALVGRGGMGAVYEARELSLGRIVAIKVLNDPSATASVAERFYREALAAARLAHINIIQVSEFVPASVSSPAFLVMERLSGMTLASVMTRQGALPIPRSLSIATQVASALGAAHAARVVHRDIKPDNLFLQDLDGSDFVKVLDFGIAKVLGESNTTTGAVLGTVAYMSPEQAMAKEVGPPADVWSLGVVLYQMLSGSLPIKHRGIGEIVSSIMRGEMVSIRAAAPSVPDPLASIVERALARDPRARFTDGEEMLRALQRARDALEVESAAPTERSENLRLPLSAVDSTLHGEPATVAPPETVRLTKRR